MHWGHDASCRRFLRWTRSPRQVQVQRRAAPAVAPVKPTTAPGMPSSPDPRRMGEAVRWLMDEDVEKPPEAWNVYLDEG